VRAMESVVLTGLSTLVGHKTMHVKSRTRLAEKEEEEEKRPRSNLPHQPEVQASLQTCGVVQVYVISAFSEELPHTFHFRMRSLLPGMCNLDSSIICYSRQRGSFTVH
jgi:glutamyl-tRNA reductase